MLKMGKLSMANRALPQTHRKTANPQIAQISQMVKVKCNSSPQRARRNQEVGRLSFSISHLPSFSSSGFFSAISAFSAVS